MTYEQIEAFLSVVTYGTFSKAANYLFVSQSTVSSRISQLEKELDVPLFRRQKGMKETELTTYGTAFIPIAGQWASLWKNTQNLKSLASIQALTVSSIDSVNNHTLVPFFNQLITENPDLKLTINTFHSGEIHGLVQSRAADIGFVFSDDNYPDIISRPVFRELMYLICRKDSPYHDQMDCSELAPENEVKLVWGQDYQQWHDLHWSPDRYPAITVNTGYTISRFLTEKQRWAVAPMSVINTMLQDPSLTYYTLKEPPAPRICYEITNRYPNLGQKQIIEAFNKELTAYIQRNDAICSFKSWMLADVK